MRTQFRRGVSCNPGMVLLLAVLAGAQAAAADVFRVERQGMLKEIENTVHETARATGKSSLDSRVMAVLGEIPRHAFVPDALEPHAYDNRPLPIGHGQTISQPYIVALMTDLLEIDADSVVLEIGTGSGYQAAVLAALVKQVYTMEIIEPLGEDARERLQRLGYHNVEVRIGDGYYGWEDHAPYDGIIVTAAAGHVPPPLVAQLKPGGAMVIPVGGRFMTQELLLVRKDEAGHVTTRQVLPVAFVPLTGEH